MKLKVIMCLLAFPLLVPVISIKAAATANNLKGRILLQVESKGEAWYVNPKDGIRYYMANGNESFQIMKNLGVGISNKDLNKVKTDANFRKQFIGKILLQVESYGEAYYISFNNRYNYLKDGVTAYEVMRKLGLGISNKDLAKINTNKKDETQQTVLSNDPSCPKIIEYEGGQYNADGVSTTTGGYYRTVKIGNQCWFKDNLNVGSMISEAINQTDNKVIEKYCYDNNADNCKIYGGLYVGGEAVQYIKGDVNIGSSTDQIVQGICPSGWHIPSDKEFGVLSDYLGGDSVAGLSLKEAGNSHWIGPVKNVTNSSGFTALPAGYSYSKGYMYMYKGGLNSLWSSTIGGGGRTSIGRDLAQDDSRFRITYSSTSDNGHSARCLKD